MRVSQGNLARMHGQRRFQAPCGGEVAQGGAVQRIAIARVAVFPTADRQGRDRQGRGLVGYHPMDAEVPL